jgi:hypothetical protein
MTPVEFPQQTTIVAENQEEYQNLPAHVDTEESILTACWKPSLLDRARILLGGPVWQQIWTFNKPLQPQILQTENPLEDETRKKRLMVAGTAAWIAAGVLGAVLLAKRKK